ncbi:MAG: hypothetical protein IAE64_08965, partial [Flavobacteriales bacterium]|nr:hypothetical protein [Flavobacteriales bacterium]
AGHVCEKTPIAVQEQIKNRDRRITFCTIAMLLLRVTALDLAFQELEFIQITLLDVTIEQEARCHGSDTRAC